MILFSGCSRYAVICSERDSVEQAGIEHFQQFVNQVEKFKSEHGKYPKNLEDLGSSIFDEGKKLPNAKITQSSYRLSPEEDFFTVEFFFDREKTCLIGNNRACEYSSINKNWSCY